MQPIRLQNARFNELNVGQQTDEDDRLCDNLRMQAVGHPIREATICQDGVIIIFDDGKCGVYSAALLLSVFSQAQEVKEGAGFQTDLPDSYPKPANPS